MTIYLHIGMEKTGTTSLQYFLAENRKTLFKLGYYYPYTPAADEQSVSVATVANHIKLTAYALRNDKYDSIRRALKIGNVDELESFRTKISQDLYSEINKQARSKDIIFSNEQLSARLITEEEVIQLRKLISKIETDIKIIVYLRRQDEFLIASHSNMLKHGRYKRLRMPTDEQIKLRYQYYHILNMWSSVFGKENLIVRVYEKNSLTNGNVINDFMDVIGVSLHDNADSFVWAPHKNVSLDAVSAEFMQQLNLVMAAMGIEREAWESMRSDVLERIRELPKGPKLKLPKDLGLEFMRKFDQSNRDVAIEYLGRENGRLFTEDPVFDEEKKELQVDDFFRIVAHILWTSFSSDDDGRGESSLR